MGKFPLRFKVVAIILALAFIFQSLHSINWHTYKISGVEIHAHSSCLVTMDADKTHLSYFCKKLH
ncbi:hypothetical protein DFQ05_0675 [Winogradskyella wandonensis]|uniref:Uncharacterized protein n=1 Tax=Winogradskyella wandonensis TaxID=1442586 RepID=A0A4R1KVE2_9FLAO|nr:hypothetical protein DFQ05_0675 [Winogradskyella wandonensis]